MVRTQKADGSFEVKTQTKTFHQVQAENAVIKEKFPEVAQALAPCGVSLGTVVLTKTISEQDIKV